MNNEERILALLDQLVQDVSGLKQDVSDLKAGQAKLEAGQVKLEAKVDAIKQEQSEMKETLDAVFEQTSNLTEFKTEISRKVDDVLVVTKENTFDITRMRAVR